MKRLLPPLLLVLTWAVMILLAIVWPMAGPFPTILRLIGALLAIVGIMIAAKRARTFRDIGTNIMTFDKPDRLVTTGLFAWSRNPMYLGFGICALGGAVALGALSSLGAAIVFCILLDRWYVRFEETVMRQTFGADYVAYCRDVRRWL